MNVAIIAPGSMGAGIARLLIQNGAAVTTTLEGRSEATRARARAAGMVERPFAEIGDCDMLLSIVPPDKALPLATSLAPVLAAASVKPLFVDCNAIAPKDAQAISAIIQATGCAFVDAGIVGRAPSADGARAPVIYASGEHAARFVRRAHGLDIRVLDAPVGAASALKLAIAGVSKGMTGIVSLMTMAAQDAGIGEAFLAQLRESQPAVLAFAGAQIRALPEKAYRWVPEMQALAQLSRERAGGADLFNGLAALYAWAAREHGDDPNLRALVERFRLGAPERS